MDLAKQAEFEKTIETMADSLMRADSPTQVYEAAVNRTMQDDRRFKSVVPQEVSLDEHKAARVLSELVRLNDDTSIGSTNAMKEIYRMIDDKSLPYQEELHAAVAAKTPLIEEKLKDAMEQEQFKKDMSAEPVTGKDIYEHAEREPEILSDAMHGKDGGKFLDYALETARETFKAQTETPEGRKAVVPDFADKLNKNANLIENRLLAEARKRSAANDPNHNPHLSAKDRKAIREHAENLALVVTALEHTSRSVDASLAEQMKANPMNFTIRVEESSQLTKLENAVSMQAVSFYNDRVVGTKNKMETYPLMPKVVEDASTDQFASSQKYASLPAADRSAAAIMEQLNSGITEQATQTKVFREAYTAVLAIEKTNIPERAEAAAHRTAVMGMIDTAIDSRLGSGAAAALDDKTRGQLFDQFEQYSAQYPSVDGNALANAIVQKDKTTIENAINQNGKDINTPE